jgi:alkanesulfonate monooxygenase SsuD/methylene tetrahydromethanopterin reductase-like flavin-dependent oxidoreductase (luciferase family)
MQLGMFMMPLHHPERPLTEALEEDLATIVHADHVGYDEVWVGEHYTATTEPITSPLIFMARAIERTSRIRLGAGVMNLPQQHPLRAAGDAALFDHLARGRFMMGIGPGGLPSDMEAFRTDPPESRGERMLEGIDMILALWSGEPPYALRGKYWTIEIARNVHRQIGMGYCIRPYQQPHPPIAVSVVNPGSYMARVAGERGWSMISAPFVPESFLQSHWHAYRAGAEAAGRAPDPANWRCGRTVVVADTASEAEAYALDPAGQVHYYYDYLCFVLRAGGTLKVLKADPSMPDEMFDATQAIRERVIWGSPRTVLDRLVALRETAGPFGGLVTSAFDWGGSAREKRSMTLLSEQVMPAFRKAIRAAN